MHTSLETFYQNINNHLIFLALQEDLGPDNVDMTNDCLFGHQNKIVAARLINKHPSPIVLCGLSLIKKIFQHLQTECSIETDYSDGNIVPANSNIAILEADIKKLLTAERTILNFIRHLSAIATLTKQYVDKVKHTTMKILDTRKTTPGMRYLEKYAVHCGGGTNHRMGLYDAIMIKDTHIDLLGGIENALQMLTQKDCQEKSIIIEIRTSTELEKVLQQTYVKVDRVLLDNMSIEDLKSCVKLAKSANLDTEASGNIHLDNVVAIAETGVDYASIGRLTHSAGQVDLAMKI